MSRREVDPGEFSMKVKDPVCGMVIDSDRAAASGIYDGETVYFCAVGCQRKFEARRAGPSGSPRP